MVTGLTQKFINVGTAFENECYRSVALSIACVNGYVEVANALLMKKNCCCPFSFLHNQQNKELKWVA